MRQRYKYNTKRPKPKGIIKTSTFCQKIQQRSSGPGERALLGLCIYENAPPKLLHLPPKSCHIFNKWFKEGRNLSIAGTKLRSLLRLHASTSSPVVYRRKRPNQWAHLELCHRNPDILERMLKRIALSSSTAGKCTPIQVMKQPEHEKTSTTEEQKRSSFQTNYD